MRRARVLVVGGYGVFGGRIVELLRDEPRLSLIVAGRSLDKARAFCGTRAGAAQLEAAHFDRGGDASQIAALRPDILVDASGPFQAYGEARYQLVEACIAQRVNYLDLADGSDFVAGIDAFDAAARAARIYVLSGVSSFPVLTAAVVRRLSRQMSRVETITGAIAPSPFAGVGQNVIRAIASYAGQPVAIGAGAVKSIAYPFTDQRRLTIAPPGRLPLKSTMFSLVDVPDLRALAVLWPEAKSVWMGAGPVPEILHRALVACAWMVRLGAVRSLSPLSSLMHWAMNRVRWGEHRGGMLVEVRGVGESGAPVRKSLHLIAEGDDGPLIPAMAVAAIVCNHLDDKAPISGARAATQDLEMEDYERLFAGRKIFAGVRTAPTTGAPLYQNIMGEAWSLLPAPLRVMHDGTDGACAEGSADVDRGRHPLAQLAAMVLGFPAAGAHVPLRADFTVREGREIWRRTFAGKSFSSEQFAGKERSSALLCERFGPLTFAMALIVNGERLDLVLRRWSVFGVPLPLWLAPRSHSFETAEGGVFQFHVEISHPWVGLIVCYRGTLERPGANHPAL
jgi:hypothetical protein